MMKTKTPLPTRRNNMKAISRGWPDMDFLKDCKERREVWLVERAGGKKIGDGGILVCARCGPKVC
jgi:hypothetical protein